MYIEWLDKLTDIPAFDAIRPHNPPTDLSASPGWTWFLIVAFAILLIIGIVLGIRESRRDPWLFPPVLIVMLFVAPTLFNLQEAPSDRLFGLWYAENTPPFTVIQINGPHMPLWITMLWFGIVPLSTLIIYRLMTTGATTRTIVIACVALGVVEMTLEAVACNTGGMAYYGYYAKIFNVPLTQFFSNGFMYVWGCAMLLWLVPRLQQSTLGAYKWLVVIPALSVAYMVGIGLALPGQISNAWHDLPAVHWTGAIIGVVLTIGVSAALLNSQWFKRTRDYANNSRPNGVPAEGEALSTTQHP